jgi:hypothetical protein
VCPASARRGVTANRHETWVAGCDGRKGVERATFARTNDTLRTAEACGPGTPGLVLSLAGGDPRGDGDYEVTDTGESTHNAVNTIAQGRPGVPAEPVVTTRVLSCCTRGCGCSQHPVFPAPSVLQGSRDCKARARQCREITWSCLKTLQAICSQRAAGCQHNYLPAATARCTPDMR